MPDAPHFINSDMLKRASRLQQRAADYRLIASKSHDPSEWLFCACRFDSQADVILEAMKAGKPMPKVDFGNEPFRG